MNIEEEFPARYWINLGRRQERRFETEWQLQRAGFTAERFPAVDARFVRKTRGYESAGRYALALSQRLAIRKAMLAGAKAVLILEDDVVFHPEITKRLEEIELPEDWGIFYLGCAHRWRPWPSGMAGLVRTPYALDTHAFAVRAPYFKQVMAALSVKPDRKTEHALASDWFLADLHQNIPTYACYPNLAWQAVSNSDLAGDTYSNYTKYGEQWASAGELIGVQAEMWGGTRWKDTSGDFSLHRPPKLGLLFLTRGNVNHPDIWREFLNDAGGEVQGFAHVKEPEKAEFLADLLIEEWHDTKWGDISLVRAMLALLRAGLEDPELTHFAFVSESCVPVKPWREIRKRLQIDPRSIIALADPETMKPKHLTRIREIKDLPVREMRVHPQWALLSREAAECIMEHDFTKHFAGIEAPDEHYFGTVLAMRGYPITQRVKCQPVTWVRWHENEEIAMPELHTTVRPLLAVDLIDFHGFFARKFREGSDIGRWGLHRATHQVANSAVP
jgi:hypothetical protein